MRQCFLAGPNGLIVEPESVMFWPTAWDKPELWVRTFFIFQYLGRVGSGIITLAHALGPIFH